MPGRLEGKVAIVTGSGSGIGQAIAERFAQEGANLVVDYRDHVEAAKETVSKIEAASGESIMVKADISQLGEGQNLVEQAWQQLGSCDILVNNAGIEKHAPFLEVREQDYDAVLDVNLKGAFF
jgi:glucose 1-dehydrogenase